MHIWKYNIVDTLFDALIHASAEELAVTPNGPKFMQAKHIALTLLLNKSK